MSTTQKSKGIQCYTRLVKQLVFVLSHLTLTYHSRDVTIQNLNEKEKRKENKTLINAQGNLLHMAVKVVQLRKLEAFACHVAHEKWLCEGLWI